MVAVVSLYRGLETFELRCEMLHLFNSGAGSRDPVRVFRKARPLTEWAYFLRTRNAESVDVLVGVAVIERNSIRRPAMTALLKSG